MAGVRIRRAVQAASEAAGIRHVVFNGYANAYASYVTTREEYAAQEYEGGSTSMAPGPRPPTSSCSSTWRWRCANACRWKPRR